MLTGVDKHGLVPRFDSRILIRSEKVGGYLHSAKLRQGLASEANILQLRQKLRGINDAAIPSCSSYHLHSPAAGKADRPSVSGFVEQPGDEFAHAAEAASGAS